MKSKDDLLRSDREQHETINLHVRQLHRLANAFSLTGNDRLAFDLEGIADEIANASATLSGNASERINIDFQDAQKSSATILRAALAGATLAKQH